MSFRALPSRKISSILVSEDSAIVLIDHYVTNSEFHSHLHPDALITPDGIKFSSNGGAIGGPVLQNLRRITAGLRGEVLEPEEETLETEDGYNVIEYGFGKNAVVKKQPEEDDDWQDPIEYGLEQGPVDIAAINDQSHVVQYGGVEPLVKPILSTQENSRKRKNESLEGEHGDGLDKEARKFAKKARKKQQRRDKEEARAEKVE